MTKLHLPALLVLILFVSGCSSLSRNVSNLVFPPHPNSDQRESEKTLLTIKHRIENPDDIEWCKKKQPDRQQGNDALSVAAAASAAGQFAEYAFDAATKFLEEEAKRYEGVYSASAMTDIVYTGGCSNDGLNIEEFTVTREVDDFLASQAAFSISPTKDETGFRITLNNFTAWKSKAKIAAIDFTRPLGFDLLAPWTALQANSFADFSPFRKAEFDAEVTITLAAVWLDTKGVLKNETVATRVFKLQNIALGKPYGNAVVSELFPMPPRSVLKSKFPAGSKYMKDQFGFGNLVATVTIKEVDSFGERVQEVKGTLESKKTTVVDHLNNI